MSKTVFRTLPVQLAADEIADMGKRSALAAKRISRLEERKKVMAKRYKEAIEESAEELSHCAGCILTGQEEREVECRIRPLYDVKKIEIVRNDTNVVVQTRSMTESEMQMSLDVMAEQFDDASGDNLLEFSANHELESEGVEGVTLKYEGQSVTMSRKGAKASDGKTPGAGAVH